MRVAIDSVGRIVIPKAFRQALGITPDTTLELILDGSGLRLEPVWPSRREIGARDGLPVLVRVEGVELTDDDVRRVRDELQH
jgi:AbrB family looped-hinge helix DNA binding protein